MFSAGAVLFTLITGKCLFKGNKDEVVRKNKNFDYIDINFKSRKLPPYIKEIFISLV
jgi:hypothetical protein